MKNGVQRVTNGQLRADNAFSGDIRGKGFTIAYLLQSVSLLTQADDPGLTGDDRAMGCFAPFPQTNPLTGEDPAARQWKERDRRR